MNSLNQTLIERLKCEICGSQARAGKTRWYSCPDQHKICQDCKEDKQVQFCGSPGKIISANFCTILEELLNDASMRFKCTNSSRGCEEILGKEAMIEHETDCIYRLVVCPSRSSALCCNAEVQYSNLIEHLKRKHGIKDFELNVVHKLQDVLMKFEFDTQEFIYAVGKNRDKEPTLYFWIQMVGSKYEAKNYYYTIELHSKDDPNVRNTYSGQVLPIDESPEIIIQNSDCKSIALHCLKKQFVDDNRALKISVSIRNMKEEAKDDNEESGISDNGE